MELERDHQSNPTTLFDPILKTFETFRYKRRDPNSMNWTWSVGLHLRLFKMLLWSLDYCQESQVVADFRSVMSVMGCELITIASDIIEERFDFKTARLMEELESEPLEQVNSGFEKKVQQLKPRVKEICLLLLDGTAFKPDESCPDQPKKEEAEKFSLEYGRQTASFIHFVLQNLEALYNLKVDLIPPVKQQIVFITRKFKGFANFAHPATHWITRLKNLDVLMSHTRIWATHISWLTCLYWIDGMDESVGSNLGTMLSDLMQKTMPYTPGVVASCLEATLIPQVFASYIDFLLKDLVLPMKDDIEILRVGLIFLLSFMMDPTELEAQEKEKILGQIYAIINEFQSLICSIKQDEMKEGVSQTQLSELLQKISNVKDKVKDLCALTRHSPQFLTQMTHAIGFLDSFLRKLKKMLEGKVNFIATVKHDITIIQEELTSLQSFLQNNLELQHEKEELEDLLTRIVKVVYYAAYVTDLCPTTGFPIWYPIICLPRVIEEINLIKNEVKEIKDHQMDTNKILPARVESGNRLLPQAKTLETERPFIGFRNDKASITSQLLNNSRRNLTIICISGMPGQGKTTLARRIYNDPSIKYHFQVVVWCYVSKGCKAKELFVKILDELLNNGVQVSPGLDIADRVRKTLKERRYLIVMDDIWDVNLWLEVQASFPNDSNGSRILFTSRNHNLVSEADWDSISHPLQLLCLEESVELMNAVVNFGDDCEPEILEIGKQIAICCKGLPLAIATTASILGRAQMKLDLWMQVAKNLTSHLAHEGFMDIIELSFKYLPDHLKPCFLYFAAFPRGESIPAKKLKLLWIAEGFVKESEMNSPENLANEYLENLVSRSLIVVTQRSDLGEIKSCNVHDLLYDLCSAKAENFLYVADESTSFVQEADESTSFVQEWDFCSRLRYNHHRLCIGASDPFLKPKHICIQEELPTSQVHSLLWSRKHHDHQGNFSNFLRHNFGNYQYSLDDCATWFFKNFKVLTVLDLEGVSIESKTFPEVILANIHLRYLALQGRFGHIPMSISDLWDLETLIIKGCCLVDPLPAAMWKMESLRHVNIEPWFRLCFEDSCVVAYNIDTLRGPALGRNPDKVEMEVEFLRRLLQLRKLQCFCWQEEFIPIWFSVFGSLKNLETLKVYGLFGESSRTPLEKLPPTCNVLFQNLKKLSLERLKLGWDEMTSTVGKQLPNLEVLKLKWRACEGRSWDLEDGDFSNLRILLLYGLNIEKINVSNCENPFLSLEKLMVKSCGKLEEIPSNFGDICSLDIIQVLYSSSGASQSAMQILTEQRDLGNNHLQVFVLNNASITAKKPKLLHRIGQKFSACFVP